MPSYNITLGMQQGIYGATETYLSKSVSLSDATALVQRLITARNACLHTAILWSGIRISQVGKKRSGGSLPPGLWSPFTKESVLSVPTNGAYPSTGAGARSDHARTSLLCRWTYDTDRTSTRYFAFPADGILVDDPGSLLWSNLPGYKILVDQFFNTLKNDNWSVKAQNRGTGFTPLAIQDWTQSSAAPTNLGIVLPSTPAPGLAINDTVKIQGVKLRGNVKVSYNGTYRIHSVNPTPPTGTAIFYLRNTEAGDPTLIKLPGTVTKVGYAPFPVENVVAIKACAHKRGAPLGSPHGKRKTRQLLG